MDPHKIVLVQTSFAKVASISDAAAAIFYDKLFTLDPALKPLFKGDMKEQGKKLMQMIAVAVRGLDNLEQLVHAVQALGKRHAGYGVALKDYDTVGSALLSTLDAGVGAEFTPAVREAWTETYGVLAGVMKEAATAA